MTDTRFKPTDGKIPQPDEVAQQLQMVLHRLWMRRRRNETTAIAAGGLSTAQLAILSQLITRGPTRMADLAETLKVRQPNISVGIQRLERMGLVARSCSSSPDLREVHIDITARGREFHRITQSAWREQAIDAVGQLTPSERRALRRALPLLEAQVQNISDSYPPD